MCVPKEWTLSDRIGDDGLCSVRDRSPKEGWKDSVQVRGKCYCQTTFDHDIGEKTIPVNGCVLKIREICAQLGPPPATGDRIYYNDIQCGNGPANDHTFPDEICCAGRVDKGMLGCFEKGPCWDLSEIVCPDTDAAAIQAGPVLRLVKYVICPHLDDLSSSISESGAYTMYFNGGSSFEQPYPRSLLTLDVLSTIWSCDEGRFTVH
eukprot:TRINITY_DN5058_c0_g1_i1.p1 TRINITY_DN5058_c0_g1~~TRINITY_DN5058_c0_g1_i1.p1  ORF type:complete len:225 (+),score=14.30 TRINITY_DN5058_c0_g1_i1:58-675(+)